MASHDGRGDRDVVLSSSPQLTRTQEHDTPPFVVACGYCSVFIPKTQNKFPAWLIRLSSRSDGLEWRSKRDFLRLFRVTASSSNNMQVPRKALNRLAEQAPWKVPSLSVEELQQVVQSCCAFFDQEENLAKLVRKDNYYVSMKRSVKQLNSFLRFCQDQATISDGLGRAWTEFCHVGDNNVTLVHPSDPRDEKEDSKAAQLGQYFCSAENAQQVVDAAFSWVTGQLNARADTKSIQRVLVLEPSCGNGGVVWRLLHSMQTNDTVANAVDRVVAYDLDESVVNACRERAKASLLPVPVAWFAADFLRTAVPEDVDVDCDDLIVVVGGPPYTSGAGSGSSMTVDLPEKFLYRCVQEWKASFVGFLLPKRYEDFTWELAADAWKIEVHDLKAGSTFFFRGTNKVTQPSILLLCSRL